MSDAAKLVEDAMLKSRPTLLDYLRNQAQSEGQSSREWKAVAPEGQQTAYRAGSSNAYLDISRRIENGEFPDVK